jgi:hypothetical protein
LELIQLGKVMAKVFFFFSVLGIKSRALSLQNWALCHLGVPPTPEIIIEAKRQASQQNKNHIAASDKDYSGNIHRTVSSP